MVPFAQLEVLEKSGNAVLKGAHNLLRNGFWKTVATKTTPGAAGFKGVLNRTSRAFYNPTTDRSTLLSKGLTGYGLAGLAAPAIGVNLPGSDLAMNATMPGMGALFTAPGLITTGRLATKGNQAKILEDAKTGAREAVGDVMSLTQSDPRYASHADLYRRFMSQYSPVTSQQAGRYETGQVAPLSMWGNMSAAFSDPQAIVNNQIDQRIPGMLSKMAGIGSVFRAAGHVLPWAVAAGGVGAVGHAALRDKPYDAAQVQSRGYAATQAAMQKKLQGLTGVERTALRLDPTIIGQQAEKVLPGTISQWEARTGNKHQPGMLSNLIDSWGKGGNNTYYEYDAAGARQYL